jgi:O-antigen ligase
LLLLGLLRMNSDVNDILLKFILFVSGVNTVVLLLQLLGIWQLTGENLYFFLFTAHNAAGGFLATLIAFTIGAYRGLDWHYSPRVKLLLIICGLSLTAGLLFSHSRGSLIGLVIACVGLLVFRGIWRKLFFSGVILAHVAVLVVGYSLSSPAFFLKELGGGEEHLSGIVEERSGTIADRIFKLWPRAWWYGSDTPIFGMGFGAFNDVPHGLIEPIPGIIRNDGLHIIHSDAHAHHTFLHVFSENGIVGLGLLLLFMAVFMRNVAALPMPMAREGLNLAFVTAIFSSLTEHRLFTPSQMLPIMLLAGLAFAAARMRYQGKQHEAHH